MDFHWFSLDFLRFLLGFQGPQLNLEAQRALGAPKEGLAAAHLRARALVGPRPRAVVGQDEMTSGF